MKRWEKEENDERDQGVALAFILTFFLRDSSHSSLIVHFFIYKILPKFLFFKKNYLHYGIDQSDSLLNKQKSVQRQFGN